MGRVAPLDVPTEQAGEWLCLIPPESAIGEPVGDAPVELGAKVIVHSRGLFRLCRVVKTGPSRITVAYTTSGGLAESVRHGWSHVTVTEKAVRRSLAFWPR